MARPKFPGRSVGVLLVLLPLFVLLPASEVTAQQGRSMEWTEVSQLELPGALGLLVRAIPGVSGEQESRQGLFLHGGVMASTDGDATTILNMNEGRWTVVDHASRTYYSMTFQESIEAMQEMMAAMEDARAEAEAEMQASQAEMEQARADMEQALAEAEARYDIRVELERTGRSGEVNGLLAEQYFLTAEIEAVGEVEGVEGAEGGALVFLVELWQSPDFPEVEALYEEWAEQFATDPALRSMAEEMSESMEPLTEEEAWEMLALWNPPVALGLRRVAEETEDLEGTTVRSVTSVALVPPGVELDREVLLAWQPASMGDAIRGQASAAAQEAARESAREAARGAMRGLSRGLLGRGGGDEEPEEEEEEVEPIVRPLLRLTQEKSNIEVGSTDASNPVFRVPEGYAERQLPGLAELRQGDPPGGR